MDGQDANRGWQDEKRESLLRDSPFRVVMRFALHLLAALLLIEEDAGCHEDGTADDERLADESRAVAGLGEAAGLGGIRAGEVLRVYAYLLQKRCIDREILNAFVRKKLIYESCEKSKDGTKEYHNAVFVGFDEHGVPRHGHKRGLYTIGKSYRGNIEGSDPKHSFHYLGGDNTLYVFEAPIDLLSYISLHPEGWQEHNYVACCGTSSIPVLEMVRQLPQLRQVRLCLDNDAAGHAASERMAELLKEHGLTAVRLVPQQKDWNDDLTADQKIENGRRDLCQTFC